MNELDDRIHASRGVAAVTRDEFRPLITEAREHDKAMTAGPWVAGSNAVYIEIPFEANTTILRRIAVSTEPANAVGIAWLRTNLARLLDGYKAALEEVARLTPTTEVVAHPPVSSSPTPLTADRRNGEASEASDVKESIAALQRMCRDEDANHDADLALAAPALVEVAAAALAWASSVCDTQSEETDDYTVAATTGRCAGDTHVWECPVDRAGRTLATALVALAKCHPIATDGARDRSRPR